MLPFEVSIVNLGPLYKTGQFIFYLSLTGIISALAHINQNTTNYRVSLFCSSDCFDARYKLFVAVFLLRAQGFCQHEHCPHPHIASQARTLEG